MSESRKKKLQMLLRSVSRGDLAEAQEIVSDADHSAHKADRQPARPIALVEACGGCECQASGGTYWLIRRTLEQIAPEQTEIARRYAAVLRGARQRLDELKASPALCHAANANPEDLLFMDTETCGFSGSPIFLVGVMFYDDGQLIFEQCLARTYAEEAAILHAFAQRLGRAGVLVTFNGKAFDMNLIRERGAFHGVRLPPVEPPHLDMLHESRRRWRGVLPNCRLQTLERYLCGRHRTGDIPGSEIPEAYHHYIRSGDARRLKDILHHNLLDMLTMAELVCAVLTGCDPAVE